MPINPYEAPSAPPLDQSGCYPVDLPGFEGRQLVVKTAGLFSGSKLLVDGQPALPGPRRGQLALRRNDGTEAVVQLRSKNFVDPVPKVLLDGREYSLVPALRWYECIWAGLPFLLIPIGGLLGGLCGALGIVINGRIFRMRLNPLFKYLLTGLVFILAALAYLILVMLLTLTLRRR